MTLQNSEVTAPLDMTRFRPSLLGVSYHAIPRG